MAKRTALVTGSTGGIGEALCQSFYDDGIEVIGLSYDEGKDTPWKNYTCDLSNIDSLENNIDEIYQKHGSTPDILVNNAGMYLAKPWDEMTPQEFSHVVQVNTTAPFILTKYWAKKIIQQNKSGVCVNVASVSALIGSIDVSYAASKSGLVMVTKTMAKALAKNKIRINAVAPGPVKTQMADKIPEERQQKYKEGIPMERFAEIEEIVSLIKFLTSDLSSYMTGSVVTVDGGLT